MENNADNIETSITVGELVKRLSTYPKDMEIYFEGFDFFRLKQRGEKILQIELTEKVHLKE